MTSNAPASGRILGSLRAKDGKGVVRMEDRYDTDIGDLWSALTEPRRLARWYGEVEGTCASAASSTRTSPAQGNAQVAWTRASPRGGCCSRCATPILSRASRTIRSSRPS